MASNSPGYTSPRTAVTDHAPTREGNGSSRTWQRTIRGVHYSFTAVLMPNGERRYAASRLTGADARFACSWTRVGFWTTRSVRTRAARVR